MNEDGTAAVLDAIPHWGHAIAQLNALIAARVGLNLSDMDGLYALHRHGPATASMLAAHVGLTSGAMSRMIDRLDAAGCLTRVRDPHDRRRVLLEPTDEGLNRVDAYYDGLAAHTRDDLADFTDDELAAVLRFVERSTASTASELERLRA